MPEPRIVFGAFDAAYHPIGPGQPPHKLGFGLVDLPEDYAGRRRVRDTKRDADRDLVAAKSWITRNELSRQGLSLLIGQTISQISTGSTNVYIYFQGGYDWIYLSTPYEYRSHATRYIGHEWPEGKTVKSVDGYVLTFEDGTTADLGFRATPQWEFSDEFLERMTSA